ncbi:hypothetical protein GCM10011609_27890 [Lentzea pudingi]|uniref:Nucleoside diphosphate kinase-like domain-containing protein n=1 Tax=Lentzea pudingi TaxID=1789439 RepID=A0ABQ2HVJ9_9PSEU|nr:nucleoside-diphosphate kinase [Lentzea pudingi]GGM89431.1 hypothetical protein GCM10011609_27890 [Lentzea pudingi]
MTVDVEAEVPVGFVERGGMIDVLGLADEIWESLGLRLGGRREQALREVVFVMVKPDAVASGKGDAVCSALQDAGARFLHVAPTFGAGERTFEELYKFNLTVRNEKNMVGAWWLNRRVYSMGPSIAALLHLPGGTGHDRLTALKGPSNPYRATPDQLRGRLGGTNLALNLVHSSDDPLSTAREFLLFSAHEELETALDRVLAPDGPAYLGRRQWLDCLDVIGRGSEDIDFVRVLTRIKLRLIATVSCGVCSSALGRQRGELHEVLRSSLDVRTAWQRHRALCAADLAALRACPDSAVHAPLAILLAGHREYSFDTAHRLWNALERLRFHTTEWERLVVDTTMYYAAHLPDVD